MDYIPIEEMRNQYLVGVVSVPFAKKSLSMWCLPEVVQPQACQYAWRKEFRHGSLREYPHPTLQRTFSSSVQATSKEGRSGGIELVKPPENSKIGDKVYFEGSDYESETV